MLIIPRKIKDWLPYIAIFLLFVGFGIYAYQNLRANKYYDKHLVSEGEFQAKNKAYLKLKRETDIEKETLARERDEEKLAREERDREINKIKADGRKKDAALVKAKAQIKELSPDELTTQLNSRVPSQYTLLGTEDFSLTRYGGELTLGIFMDGERCIGKLSERNAEIEKYKTNEISFNDEIFNLNTDLKLTEIALAGCDLARLAAITSKENLEKAFKAMKLKQFIKGAGGGALLVVVILKIAGVI